MLIAFEGIDGAGKSTQMKLLHAYLSNKFECVSTTEPSAGPVGMLIRKMLRESVRFDALSMQLLFCADRAYHVKEVIEPALKKGKIVLVDRYALSTIAYGAAAGLNRELLARVTSQFPVADATFIMEVGPQVAIERIHERGSKFLQQKNMLNYISAYAPEYKGTELQKTEMFERLEFLSRVSSEYKRLSKEHKNCFVFDGERGVEEIEDSIIKVADKIIEKHHLAPIV